MATYDEIRKRLQNYGNAVANDTRTVIDNAGKEICRQMKERVPKDTGKLKASIRHKTEQSDNTVTTTIYADAKNSKGTPYWEFVEYGTGLYLEPERGVGRQTPWKYKDDKGQWHKTSGQKPQPYVRPAVNAVVPVLEDELRKQISKEVR